MMTKRKREHAAKMRAKRPIRPWDHVSEDDAERSILRMRKMFEAGMPNEHIANALSISVLLVQVLRDKRLPQG
jgi:hypothetical protein